MTQLIKINTQKPIASADAANGIVQPNGVNWVNKEGKSESKRKTDIHTSQFLITVNPNSTDLKYESLLHEALDTFYENIEEFLNAADPSKVDEIQEPTALVDIGPKFHRVHSHMFIRIIHRTKVQINLSKARSFFNRMLGTKSHFDVKWIKDNTVGVVNYLHKARERMEDE